MAPAKNGDTVKIHYTGKLTDGTVFDSSEGRDPLEFTLGQGMVIPGFEQGIVDMNLGEKKTINIDVENAYGPLRQELMFEVPKEQLPPDMAPEVGMQLQMMQGEGGQPILVTIAAVGDEAVTLDANHPLAGKELIFDIELVSLG